MDAPDEGKFLDEKRKAPDVPARLRAVELIGRMRGHFVDRHEVSVKDGGDIVFAIKLSYPTEGTKED